ncbi:MAG: PorT family protein [Sphingobacteriales bacterium]|nr:PorT family protein [Sphingobacteriales bacterium]MCC7224425.1 PorT family protein [Chitinophagales bacterium]
MKKLFLRYVAVTLFFIGCLFGTALKAQTFKGGIVAGANFTQIDGDAIAGYTKVGINAGVASEIVLGKRWSLALELLYSQKGSASSYSLTSYGGVPFQIRMHYADIPVLVRYHDVIGGLTFGGGASVGRLLGYKYVEDGLDLTESFDMTDKFNDWDLQLIGDISYMFTPVWGINFRIAYSALSIRTDCANSLLRNCAQVNNVLSLRTVFMFSALNQKNVAGND